MSYLNTSLNPQTSDPTPRHRGRRVRRPRPILVGGRHRADVADEKPEPDPVAVGREIAKALNAYDRAGGRR